MSNLNYILYGQQTNASYDLLIPNSVRFWLYFIPEILSIWCTAFVLFHLLYDRTLRRALHNHVILLLLCIGLIYEFTSVPLMLCYYHLGDQWEKTISLSHFWTFIDYICYTIQLLGFAWATIERHILIFNHQWVATSKRRFFIHYLPLILILSYCFTYYFVLVIFPFCADSFISSPFNGVPISCILLNPISIKYDTFTHQMLPTIVIITSGLVLLVRVLRLKNRLHQAIQWRKQRKMTVQLLSISTLYVVFMGPRTILQFCFLFGLFKYEVLMAYFYSGFFANYIIFLFPFVCCGSMPELGKKLKRIFCCQKPTRITTIQHLPAGRVFTQRQT